MISHLPRWVEFGAFILAMTAGTVNAIGLLGFEHQSVSHLSGTATLLGTEILNSSFQKALHLTGILMSFLIGAAIAGFLLHASTLKLGRHYDTLLFIESLLIFLSSGLLLSDSYYGHFLASAACGLQNAMVTTFSGAIIRTTHITGIFTDLGIMLGATIRGQHPDRRRVKLFILIILGFTFGGMTGAISYSQLGFYALMIPGAICLLLGLSYRVYVRIHVKQPD